MNARTLAIQVLARVRATDAYLNVVLDTQLSESPLKDPRDAALVTELAYGSHAPAARAGLRHHPLRGPEAGRDGGSGARRAAHRRLPALPHPGARARGGGRDGAGPQGRWALARAAGFVNAILRKLADAAGRRRCRRRADAVEYLSMRESHPRWLVERWLRQFGRERAEAMLVADNQPPPSWFASTPRR